MDIDLRGPGSAAYSLGMEPSGREHAVIVVKRRLSFPMENGGTCTWSDAAPGLTTADIFAGDPNTSATLAESDFALRKPACDVLLYGAAHAPGGRPVTQLHATMKVAGKLKSVLVFGNRVWERTMIGPMASDPEPFLRQEVTYDHAFGGADVGEEEEDGIDLYRDNPAGKGWARRRSRGLIDGMPLPNLEDSDNLVAAPWNECRPMAFGAVGRSWPIRARWGGTYDDAWLADRFPFLPDDFDDRYYQAAPPDQQIRHPVGGEEIVLNNLMEGQSGPFQMRLPALDLPVVVGRHRAEDATPNTVCDTLTILPEERAIDVVTRAAVPLARDILELKEAIIGRRGRGFWRARALGKRYNSGLRHIGRAEVPRL